MTISGFLLVVLLAGNTTAGNPVPASAQEHLGSGNKLMQMERFKEASQQFELALHDDPTLSEARRQLVACYFELREYESARRLCGEMRAAKENPELATYYMGRIDLVEQNFDSAIRRFQSLGQDEPVRDELYYLGVAYFKQGKYPDAVEVLKKAVASNPRDYRVHQFLARSYQKLGQTKNAEQEFSETQRLHDYYLQGTVAIGECRSLLLGGQPEKAWEACRPLLETDDVDKLVSIGMLFGKAEKYEQALSVWDKAVALDPESPEINYNLALTCFHLKNMPRAHKHVAAAVQLRPDFFEANLLYGTILYMTAEDEPAIRVLTRAHELRPDDGSVRRLLAQELMVFSEVLAKRNDLQRARVLLQQAAALRPDSEEISSKLAQLRARISGNP
jgi:tetratricopeptide (TPR) repeat protein